MQTWPLQRTNIRPAEDNGRNAVAAYWPGRGSAGSYGGNFAGQQRPRLQQNAGLSVRRHDPVTRPDHRF